VFHFQSNSNPSATSGISKIAKIEHWQSPHAVTLTMKQGVPVANGYRSTMAFLDGDKASQNLRHFHSVISRTILGKPADRFGQRVNLIPVIEGGNGNRLHYHVVIDCPRDDLKAEFPSLIADKWLRTQWATIKSISSPMPTRAGLITSASFVTNQTGQMPWIGQTITTQTDRYTPLPKS
jgi:hypothetical protein